MQQQYQRRIRVIVGPPDAGKAPGLLGRALGVLLTGVALVGAFMISVVALAIVSVFVVIGVGYVWWKTRDLRRQLRENPPGGRVIDGDAVRDRD